MVPKRKKMSLVLLKVKIPRTHYDEISRLAEIRNRGNKPDQYIDESYLASESLMKQFQPEENV